MSNKHLNFIFGFPSRAFVPPTEYYTQQVAVPLKCLLHHKQNFNRILFIRLHLKSIPLSAIVCKCVWVNMSQAIVNHRQNRRRLNKFFEWVSVCVCVYSYEWAKTKAQGRTCNISCIVPFLNIFFVVTFFYRFLFWQTLYSSSVSASSSSVVYLRLNVNS